MVNTTSGESLLGLPPSDSGGAISKQQAAFVGERRMGAARPIAIAAALLMVAPAPSAHA
jgi:hypothetical protein